jgi:hypothetical protein
MGAYKAEASLRSSVYVPFRTRSTRIHKMAAPALQPPATNPGNLNIVRCSQQTLTRLQNLNQAEYIVLFNPWIPRPPQSDNLPPVTDPFGSLGQSLGRIKHVPYTLQNGFTDYHRPFVPQAGAIVVVVCVTRNVLDWDADALQPQVQFAEDVGDEIRANLPALVDVPLLILLVTDGPDQQTHVDALQDFPALVALDDYSAAALDTVRTAIFPQR